MLSTKIAFYIIYVLIEAMRPTLNKNNLYSGKIKDGLVKEWVANAIRAERMLWEFVKLPIVQKGLRQYGKNAYSDDDAKWSLYEMDNANVFDELREICKSLDPDAFEELEKIRIQEIPLFVNDKLRISQNKEIKKDSLIYPEMVRKLFY